MLEINKVYCGDNLTLIKQLDDNSIDLTVTSPPYDNLRDYKGYSWDFEGLAKELHRVTKEGGVVVWVVGDATINGSETGTSFKQALYFKEIGFNIHDTMIYKKHNFSNPASNRYHQIFEYMFIFSKKLPNTFNAIKDRINKYAGYLGTWGNNIVVKKDGTKKKRPRKIISDYGLRHNIWEYITGKIQTDTNIYHPAVFPEQLAHDHIISWSNEGDIILDPFMGSGTTAIACLKTKRKFIGFEISQEYCDIARDRIRLNNYTSFDNI